MTSLRPLPVVVEKIGDQLLPSPETWIWYALPYAGSHCSTTWLICAVAPRSTEIQPGSTQPLVELVAQRLAGSLSNALSGVHGLQFTSFCDVEACAGLLYDNSLVPPGPVVGGVLGGVVGGVLGGVVGGVVGVVPPAKTWNSQNE